MGVADVGPPAPIGAVLIRSADNHMVAHMLAAGAQRIRRMCTLCTNPNIAKYTIRLEPP
jgi:hypothetical protein